MKRFVCLLIALMMIAGCSLAQEVATPFPDAVLTIDAPQGYELELIEHPDMLIVDLHSPLLGALEYHIVISKLDFEFMDEASMEDLTQEQLETMSVYAAGEVEYYTHGMYTLPNGVSVMIIDEEGDEDVCALGYMLVNGYLIGVRADRCGTIGPLMPQDYDRLMEVLGGIHFQIK